MSSIFTFKARHIFFRSLEKKLLKYFLNLLIPQYGGNINSNNKRLVVAGRL